MSPVLLQVEEAQGLADWFSTASVAAVLALCGGLACWFLIRLRNADKAEAKAGLEAKDKIIEQLAERRRVCEELRLEDRTTWLEARADDVVRFENALRATAEAVEQSQHTAADAAQRVERLLAEIRRELSDLKGGGRADPSN